MFDWIPIESYTSIYYYVMCVIVLITLLHSQSLRFGEQKNRNFIAFMGFFLLIFVILYMGLRPIHGVFVDMTTYNGRFENFQKVGVTMMDNPNDYLFDLFTLLCSKIMTAQMYFFTCALLYVGPLWIVSKKWFGSYWFYGFLTLVISLSFWNFGTNGIRNGIASSIFLLGISRDKRLWQIIWIIVAINFHKSMMLPALGFVLATIYNKPKYYLLFWIICIPLSLSFGTVFQELFSGFVEDERVSYLIEEVNSSLFSSVGFRWDFLLYSAAGVFAGWFYIFIRKFQDQYYNILYCTFLFANAFWILVIRANFSNRFAYLSWFMMAMIIFYPLLKKQFLRKQYSKIGFITLAYFFFTFLLNVMLSK